MKLLIDIRSLGSTPSGVGIYAYNFVKGLSKYNDLQIELISDVDESNQIQELQKLDNITLHLYGEKICKTFAVIEYFRYVQKIINEVRPDIFWEVNNLIPIKIENPYGRNIVTIHDMFPIYMKKCYGKIYPIYFKYGIYNTLKCVDGIIYNSRETKKETEKFFPKSKEINNFILPIIVEDKDNFEIIDQDYFFYIGNLEKRKGTDILLKAYWKYRKFGGTKRMLLAGKFREKDLEKLYYELSSDVEGLKYLGYVDDCMKDQLLAECSCFVFPSRAEGFGIPIIEALIKSKPILITDLPIFRETVGDLKGMLPLDEDIIERFAQAMLQSEMWSRCDYDISLKYSSKKLSQELYLYFLNGRDYA